MALQDWLNVIFVSLFLKQDWLLSLLWATGVNHALNLLRLLNMKDQKDSQTLDIFTGKTRAGRPCKYIDQAAKQREYRKRLKVKRQSIS